MLLAAAGFTQLGAAPPDRPEPSEAQELELEGPGDVPSYPHLATTDSEIATCPFPDLTPVCPCIVEHGAPPIDVHLAVDVSESAFGKSDEHAGDYRSFWSDVRTAAIALASRYRDQNAVGDAMRRITCHAFHTQRIGDCSNDTVVPKRGHYTDLRSALPAHLSKEGITLVAVATDGIQFPSYSPNSDLCEAWRAQAQDHLAATLDAHPNLHVALLRTSDRGFETHCREPVRCPDNPRCSHHDIEDHAGAGERVAEILRARLESIGQPGVRQHVLVDDFSSVLQVGDGHRFKCTGILLNPSTALTARHCAPATRIRLTEAGSGRVVSVVASTPHPSLDAMVLTLERPVQATILDRRDAAATDPPGGSLRYVGFGALRPDGRGFGRPKELSIQVAGWGCDGNRSERFGCRPGQELVAPGGAGGDTCVGDSGGPLFELVTLADRCVWRLVAITSRRVPDGTSSCGSGGIYTRADALDSWIERQLKP